MKQLPQTTIDLSKFSLEDLEDNIEKSQDALFLMLASAIEIKNRRLYADEYDSWEDYCQKRWGWTRVRFFQMEQFFKLVKSLPESNVSTSKHLLTQVNIRKEVADAGERSGRELLKVPEEKRVATVIRAVAAGDTSPKGIQQAAAVVKAPEPVRDAENWDIPTECLPFWNRRQEIQDMMTAISKVKMVVEKAKAESDPMYGHAPNAIIGDLAQAHYTLSQVKPYAVCTECNGHPKSRKPPCGHCTGSGLISKHKWDTSSRKEVKEARANAIAKRMANES